MYYNFDENEILEEGLFSDIKDKIHLYSSVKQLQKNVMSTSADHMSNRTDTNIELMGGGPEGIPFGNKLIIENGYITIKNINFVKFFQRIKEFYAENNFSKIFMKVYTNRSEKLWKKGKIAKKDMTVKYLRFPVFFALEIAMILEDLGSYYGARDYIKMARKIRTKTWLQELHRPVKEIDIDTSGLQNIKFTLKDYQLDFIKMYPTLKNRFNLDGYLLSFDQGLGKTLLKRQRLPYLDQQLYYQHLKLMLINRKQEYVLIHH